MITQNSKLETQNGFTLIELTIAFTLLALILMIAYGAFYLGHRAVEKGQTRLEEDQKLRAMQDLVGTYIRSAHPYKISPHIVGIFFSGDENNLFFVSTVSIGMGGRGMSKISISWQGEGGSGAPVVFEEEMPPRFGDQDAGSGVRNSVVVLREVRSFKIDYLNPQLDPQTQEENWEEEWDGADKGVLPSAVRFNLRDDRGQEIQWVFPVMQRVLAP